jgi:hypothetical protein
MIKMIKNNKLKVALGLTALGSAFIVDNSFAVPQTFTGSLVPNLYGGNVQVQITVDAGVITTITTPVQPTGSNAQFANMAIPTLISEAIVSQSANIQGVSGASAISAAWKTSLASAIASAGSAIGVQTPAPTTTPTPTPTQVPSVNISGNTVCSTASPTPIATSTATSTVVTPDPTVSPTATPTVTPTPRETEVRPTPTPTVSPTATPTVTPTPRETEVRPTPTPTSRESGSGEKDLIISIIPNGANSTTTITIIKTITQNQVVTCTTTNTVTNTVTTGNTPSPTVTVTAIPLPAPTVTITATPEPIILKPGPVIVYKKIVKVVKVYIVKCKKNKTVKRFATSFPVCPKGYTKVK